MVLQNNTGMGGKMNCPACGRTNVSKCQLTSTGNQVWRCMNPSCKKRFVAGEIK